MSWFQSRRLVFTTLMMSVSLGCSNEQHSSQASRTTDDTANSTIVSDVSTFPLIEDPMYESMAIIPEDCDFSFEVLVERLKEKLEGFSVERRADTIRASVPDWTIQLTFSNEPHVVEESREIADAFGVGRPDKEKIGSATRRVEVSGGDDADMEHFNDYIFVNEVLESFPGVVVFDPAAGEFL